MGHCTVRGLLVGFVVFFLIFVLVTDKNLLPVHSGVISAGAREKILKGEDSAF